uniref:ORF4 n=1 Tax=Cydia pomonella granulosis virus TaxID=28289 RepID=A0A097P265_GVCP|nr:ORF4 [Cydia pomonella granulovirus]
MLSIFFDEHTVYYHFDDILREMIRCGFERVDKKVLACDRLKIRCANEQVYCTNGVDMDLRLLKGDECYVSFEGVMELMDSNSFGDKNSLEIMIVNCTLRVVLQPNHAWLTYYKERLRMRINTSFDFYFKVLEQYMLANQPNVERIGPTISKLIRLAEHYKHLDDHISLIEACHAFDRASAILIQNIKL